MRRSSVGRSRKRKGAGVVIAGVVEMVAFSVCKGTIGPRRQFWQNDAVLCGLVVLIDVTAFLLYCFLTRTAPLPFMYG